jgi:hypothetical protein
MKLPRLARRGPFETRLFYALHGSWMRRLQDEDFDDIEHGRRDGNGPLASPLQEGAMFAPEPEILAQCADESREVVAAAEAIEQDARAVLDNEALWVLLPKAARYWWALQVISGFSAKRAADLLGVYSDLYQEWQRRVGYMRSVGFER